MHFRSEKPLFDCIALALLAIFLLNDIMGGAIRYYAVQFGLPWLAYMPAILMIVALAPMFMAYVASEGVTSTYLTVFALLAISSTYGVFNLGSWGQVCYGFWSLVPFLTGIVVVPAFVRSWKTLLPYALGLWVLAVAGVLINYFHTWPWIGFEYQLGAMSVSASRLWHIDQFGLFRLPGFSQASYFVAPQILILALFLRETLTKRYWIAIWISSGVAIALTTSKTLVLVFFIFSLFWFFSTNRIPRLLQLMPLIAAAFAVLLPFSMLFVSLNWLSTIQSPISEGLVATFIERMEVGWPEWIRMIIDHGNPLLGRGLGGIGTAQQHFEPALFSPSDNIAVFVYATFGVLGLAVLFSYARKASRASPNSASARFFLYSACVVLLGGTTLSVMDASLLGLTFGASLRYFEEAQSVLRLSSAIPT